MGYAHEATSPMTAPPRLFAVAASPAFLTAAGQELTFRRWSIDTTRPTGLSPSPIPSDPRPPGSVSAIALLNDGRVVTAGVDRKIRLWQPNGMGTALNGTEFHNPQSAAEVRGLAAKQVSGSDFVASIGLDGLLVIWRIPAAPSPSTPIAAVASVALSSPPVQGLAVAWSLDGSTIAVARSDAKVELFAFTP